MLGKGALVFYKHLYLVMGLMVGVNFSTNYAVISRFLGVFCFVLIFFPPEMEFGAGHLVFGLSDTLWRKQKIKNLNLDNNC